MRSEPLSDGASDTVRGFLVLVPHKECLEAGIVTEWVPARVEPQRVDAKEPWSCEKLLDLI